MAPGAGRTRVLAFLAPTNTGVLSGECVFQTQCQPESGVTPRPVAEGKHRAQPSHGLWQCQAEWLREQDTTAKQSQGFQGDTFSMTADFTENSGSPAGIMGAWADFPGEP